MSIRRWIGIAAALAFAAPASALTLDFEEFTNHGDIVTTTQDVVVTAENFDNTDGHPDTAVAFDSLYPGATTDPDLLQGADWTSGNLKGTNIVLGNLLIVQENDATCGISLCSDPDDQAGVGGQISFDFSLAGTGIFDTFAFDLVDHEPGSESGSIQFLLGGNEVGFQTFASFLGLGQGVVYGDNSANHIDLDNVGDFDQVVIALRGSGAIDNIAATVEVVPEPNSMALGGLGLVMLATVGRRRRRR